MPDNITSRLDGDCPALAVSMARARRAGVRVWDLPTRVFHWALLACVIGAVASAQLGGNWMDWHPRFGAAILGLLVFRIIWGFAGPRYARFRSFAHGPQAVWAHLKEARNHSQRHAGHSPAGGASVFALLGILVALSASGLLSSDSISLEGALVRFASESIVNWATPVHVWLQWVLYTLVGLHLAAVLAYLLVKKDNLIGPMIHGDKTGIRAREAADSFAVRLVGLALMGGAIAAAILITAPR
jgi:cytochrome b